MQYLGKVLKGDCAKYRETRPGLSASTRDRGTFRWQKVIEITQVWRFSSMFCVEGPRISSGHFGITMILNNLPQKFTKIGKNHLWSELIVVHSSTSYLNRNPGILQYFGSNGLYNWLKCFSCWGFCFCFLPPLPSPMVFSAVRYAWFVH